MSDNVISVVIVYAYEYLLQQYMIIYILYTCILSMICGSPYSMLFSTMGICSHFAVVGICHKRLHNYGTIHCSNMQKFNWDIFSSGTLLIFTSACTVLPSMTVNFLKIFTSRFWQDFDTKMSLSLDWKGTKVEVYDVGSPGNKYF